MCAIAAPPGWGTGWGSAQSWYEDLGEVEFLSTMRRASSASLRLWLRAWLCNCWNATAGANPAYWARAPFGLFDDDAAVERDLQLLVEHLPVPDRPLLQDADRRHVRQRPVPGRGPAQEMDRRATEQIECADRPPPQPQRQCVHGAKSVRHASAATNAGHRSAASVRSVTVTGAPLWKQSRHGPSSLCSCNNSMTCAASSDAATARSSHRASPSTMPAASAGSSCTQNLVNRSSRSMTSYSSTRCRPG
jgi:hypothetical protein